MPHIEMPRRHQPSRRIALLVLAAAVAERFPRLDILFNNAGVYYPQTALECSEREWDEQIDVNLKGTFLMSKCALPVMIAQTDPSK